MTSPIRRSSDSRRSVLVAYVKDLPGGTEVSYDDLAFHMQMDSTDVEAIGKIQQAKGDAATELGEIYHKGLKNIPGLGYVVVEGEDFFTLMLEEARVLLQRINRTAKRMDYIEGRKLTTAQRTARTAIAGELRMAWSRVRKAWKHGFLTELPDLDDEDDQSDPLAEAG